MPWGRLKSIYERRGVVLALGAGVSIDSQLPQWVELLERLGKRCLGERGDEVVAALINDGFSLPAVASMLKNKCPAGASFSDFVRDALYQEFLPYKCRGIPGANLHKLVDLACKNNSTLKAVAAFCAKWNDGAPALSFSRNNGVHAVVSFNLDGLLRAYIPVRYGDYLVRSVERASKTPDPRKTSIYYMHGFLRFDSDTNNPDKEAFDKLVLSEQEYFDLFNSPTSLFNYTFLHLLREHSCLFIGLSMQDDNIRRLLHYSKKERQRAYEEERQEKGQGSSADKIKEKWRRHFAILPEPGSELLRELLESSLGELGVNALWVSDFAEIPERLGLVYGAGWEKVYW